MQIEEIFTQLDSVIEKLNDKYMLARKVAREAHKQGNIKKRDKFNAVARVYWMVILDISPLACELLQHTSKEFQDDSMRLPF